jgi:hypothetical protein
MFILFLINRIVKRIPTVTMVNKGMLTNERSYRPHILSSKRPKMIYSHNKGRNEKEAHTKITKAAHGYRLVDAIKNKNINSNLFI